MKKTMFQREQDALIRSRAGKKAEPKQYQEENKAAEDMPSKRPQPPVFDWPNITGADFDEKVEPYLARLGDRAKQILYLKRLLAEFREGADNYLASRTLGGIFPLDESANGFIASANKFFFRLSSMLKKLIAMQKIEEEEASLKAQTIKETEPERGKPKFSAAQCCLVVHYFLHEAGYKSDEEKDATVKSLLVAMTGLDASGVSKKWDAMFTRDSQTPKDLRVLKPYFEKLGLPKIVARIEGELSDRKNDDEYVGDENF